MSFTASLFTPCSSCNSFMKLDQALEAKKELQSRKDENNIVAQYKTLNDIQHIKTNYSYKIVQTQFFSCYVVRVNHVLFSDHKLVLL